MDCASDEVRAHQQLLDLGLTAEQIARHIHVPNARVKQTRTTRPHPRRCNAIRARRDHHADVVLGPDARVAAVLDWELAT
ncbi:MAG: hypothetical protein L0K86_25950, partial [Actinomycetia bacterium]|nr:hypothetical protein [Actinomycetes bacterium]